MIILFAIVVIVSFAYIHDTLIVAMKNPGCKLQKQQIVTCGPKFFFLIFYGKRSNLSMGMKFSQGNFHELLNDKLMTSTIV